MSQFTWPLSGSESALWLARLPHRGNFSEGRRTAQIYGPQLEAARLTGYTFIFNGGAVVGVQIYLMGKVIGMALGNLHGAEAAQQLAARSGALEVEARRATRPQVMAALAAPAGQVSAQLEHPSAEQLAALRTQLAAGFTGLVGLLRAPATLVEAYAYHEGRPVDADLPASASGMTLIQLSSPSLAADGNLNLAAAPPPAARQVGEPPAAPPPPVPAPEPVAVPAAGGIDVERLWLAALAVYSSELGPAGVGAVNKLRASVRTASPQAQLDTVRQRISATLGAQAVATFERQFGG